jgi:hypothetical protein
MKHLGTPFELKRTNFSGIRYLSKRYSNKLHVCPFCIAHKNLDRRSTQAKEMLFNKWVSRPNSAYALYWKTHKDLYKQLDFS